MTAPFEHADEVRVALRSIVSDPALGPDALDNSRAAANLLRDLLPDAPRETGLLLAAISAGVPAMLRESIGQGIDGLMAVRLTAAALASRTAFGLGACEWVTAELAVALDLAPGAAILSHPATEVRAGIQPQPADPATIGADGFQPAQHSTVPGASAVEPGGGQGRPRRARFAVLCVISLVVAASAGAGIYAISQAGSNGQNRGSRPRQTHRGNADQVVSEPPRNAWIAEL